MHLIHLPIRGVSWAHMLYVTWELSNMHMQDDIDEVNKIAHNLKARLDYLAKLNEAALKRKVRFTHQSFEQIPHHNTCKDIGGASVQVIDRVLCKMCTCRNTCCSLLLHATICAGKLQK